MAFIQKNSVKVTVIVLGIVMSAIIVALILRTEIRVERHVEVVGPDEPVYYMIVRGEPLDLIKRELEKNPQLVHTSYIINKTLLAHAAKAGRVDVVRLLLDRGAHPDGLGRPGESTPLLVAVACDRKAIAQMLVEHGANPKLRSSFGSTPQSLAENSGDEQMLRILAKDWDVPYE